MCIHIHRYIYTYANIKYHIRNMLYLAACPFSSPSGFPPSSGHSLARESQPAETRLTAVGLCERVACVV